jgi:hypothetical protein
VHIVPLLGLSFSLAADCCLLVTNVRCLFAVHAVSLQGKMALCWDQWLSAGNGGSMLGPVALC